MTNKIKLLTHSHKEGMQKSGDNKNVIVTRHIHIPISRMPRHNSVSIHNTGIGRRRHHEV